MSVQRYQASRVNGMLESPNGAWVLYDDVKQGREADARIMEEYGATILKLQDKLQRRELLIKSLEKEIEKHLDARFHSVEAHVKTMGYLVEINKIIHCCGSDEYKLQLIERTLLTNPSL